MFLSTRDLTRETPSKSRRPLASRQWRQTLRQGTDPIRLCYSAPSNTWGYILM